MKSWAFFDFVVTGKVWAPRFCRRGASSPVGEGWAAWGLSS